MHNTPFVFCFSAVIELACGEYGEDKIALLISSSGNGNNMQWFGNADALVNVNGLRSAYLFQNKAHRYDNVINKDHV